MTCSKFAFICILILSPTTVGAADRVIEELQGVGNATSLEFNGKPRSAKETKRVRFIFKENNLTMVGTEAENSVIKATFRIDPKASPKHITIELGDEDGSVLAIYKIKGDVLTICARNAFFMDEGRPTEFKTTTDSWLLLSSFKRMPAAQ